MCSNSYVSIVTRTMRVINVAKSLAEKVIEALMNAVSLNHYCSMTLYGKVENGSYGIDLKGVVTEAGLQNTSYHLNDYSYLLQVGITRKFTAYKYLTFWPIKYTKCEQKLDK